jgi:succinate dehydrogenase / fumarate reductase membrane anchor subunit
MLVLALLHGVNGLRVITLDYIRPHGARLAVNTFFAILGAALMVLGTIIVVTFDPTKWPAT